LLGRLDTTSTPASVSLVAILVLLRRIAYTVATAGP
jgi:hypothetical protein